MSDPQVGKAQNYVNGFSNPQIPDIPVDGKTSWSVMYALTRVLQSQLGITTLSDNFGPGTLSALQAKYPVIGATTPPAVIKTIQAAMYCKGYDGGNISGNYGDISVSVAKLKTDMGFTASFGGTGLTPKMVKALMTMDPFVLIAGGDANVRSVQQWLNQKYVNRVDFFVVPCDGYFSRDVQRALMFAIQYQIGMADGVANGYFGTGTQNGLKANPLTVGSSGTWVQLFTAALIFNKRPGSAFVSTFTSTVASVVSSFQSFVKLPVTAKADFQTWASLLVSTGDPDRPGTAADCVSQVTDSRAIALRAAGYTVVGRYLSNVPNTQLNKKLQDGEVTTIARNGLRVFPIYQTFGGAASYFNEKQGFADAGAAIERSRFYGFLRGTTIYFAVDFDALDFQITDNVLPHFRGIKRFMSTYAPEYSIGIYGPRNACIRVGGEGLTTSSFLCDMSTGFSGNLGFPLPQDWAFDQIATISVGSGAGLIEIDKNVSSGRDMGQNTFAEQLREELDVAFDRVQRDSLLADIQTYWKDYALPESGGPGENALTKNSTTYSVDKVISLDSAITNLSRVLRMRKSLIQSVVVKEIREFSSLDVEADDAVKLYYTGGPQVKSDSSTGLAQMFASVSISATNYCIDRGIIFESRKSNDIWTEWQKLHNDEQYNLEMVPRILIHAASLIGLERPGVTTSELGAKMIMARYNGTGSDAAAYGDQLLGIYRIFEKYNAPLRAK